MISEVVKGGASRPQGFGGGALNKRKSPLGQPLGEAQAKPEFGHFSGRTEGVWGRNVLTFLGDWVPNPYLVAHDLNNQKMNQQKRNKRKEKDDYKRI